MRSIVSLVCATATILVLLLAGGPAQGAPQNHRGMVGAVQVPNQAGCYYVRTNTSGGLSLGTVPPVAWAARGRTQAIRYRLLAANVANGRTISASNWSQWQVVRGTQAARWNGYGYIGAPWQSNVRLMYFVEFHRPGGQLEGSTVATPNSYQYFDQRVGPFGPITSCYKWR